VETVTLIISVAAYVVLIGRYGALGAAYGSLVGYTSCLALAAVLLTRIRRAAGPVSPSDQAAEAGRE
jgi:O-antigen/teichoic acid export membrane protein